MNTVAVYRDTVRVVSVTGVKRPSKNPKTGDMLQVQISPLRTDPLSAMKSGKLHNGCEGCPLGPNGNRACYVNPLSVQSTWRATKGQRIVGVDTLPPKAIRLGSWGDPAMMPEDTLEALVRDRGYTGYTHQWRKGPERLSERLMASVESVWGQEQAKSKGYRTFRILPDGANLATGETLCPNYSHGVQCRDCLLCSGSEGRGKADIAIYAHGSRKGSLWR